MECLQMVVDIIFLLPHKVELLDLGGRQCAVVYAHACPSVALAKEGRRWSQIIREHYDTRVKFQLRPP